MSTTPSRAAGLVAACDDRRLLSFPLWPRQRALLESVERHRTNVWALGRRSGKTTTAALVGVHACTLRPELRAHLRPGERGYAVAVAVNLRQARLIVSAARSIVERSPLLSALVETITDDEIAFTTGHSFAAFPATSRGGRGWAIHTLVLDECAHMLDNDGNSAAESIWRALVPSTGQFGADGRVVVSSTPFGSDGLFSELFQKASSGELADAHAEHATTEQANPTITPEFLEAERQRDPDGYLSEYEARFVGGGSAFLDPERIAEAVADRGELLPEQATQWIAGCDASFSRDPFAVVLVGRDRLNPARLVVGKATSWLPRKIAGAGGSFEERRGVEDLLLNEVAHLCTAYRAHVHIDQHVAPAVLARLRQAGLQVTLTPWTAQSKTDAFSEVRARLNGSSLELYPHADLLRELRSLRTRFAAGSASVVTPRVGGTHSDMAVALALATFAHRRPPLSDDSAFAGVQGERLDSFGGDHFDPIRYGDMF